MEKELFTMIVFFKPERNMRPRKYHNVQDGDKLSQFLSKIGAWYGNLYYKRSRKFAYRKYA